MPDVVGELIVTAIAASGEAEALVALAEGSYLGISGITAIGTTAILGASIGLNYALNNTKVPKPEDGSQAIKQAIPPRIRGYGTNRLAGAYMLYEEINHDSYDVIAFHSGRIGAILGYFLHDDPVTVSGGTVQNSYADGRYGGGKISIETRLGTASQSAPGFVSVGGVSAVWTTAHRGKGIAWAAMSCGAVADVPNFTKIYPHNHPELSVIAECSVVWDPRDPAQSRDDESTWLVSHNPMIQAIDLITRQDGGLGQDYETVIAPKLAQWITEADLCDATVQNAEGVDEARYRSSGWFQFDNRPEDVLNNLLATCDGWLAESGDGTLSPVVGVYRVPIIPPLTEKHIFGFSLNYGQPDEQLVNQLEISFTDPASNYVSVQTQPWRDESSISEVGLKSQPLDLKWVQSNSQARRLAARAMQRLNPKMTGSFVTSLYGLRYLGRRWVPLQYPFVSGLQDCVIEVQGAEVDLLAGRINWTFIRISPETIEAYYPPTDDGPPVVVPPRVPHFVSLDFSIAINSGYVALLEDI